MSGAGAAGAFPHPFTLAQANAAARDTAISNLGIEFTEVGPDFLRATMPVDARTKQPFGLLHGGASVLLAETLASLGAQFYVDPASGDRVVGLEINANHLRALTEGRVTGTGRAVHVGRRTQVWEVRITDERDRLVCLARMTAAIIAG